MPLTNFFNPRSIAIIGASADRNKVGYALMANLVTGKIVGKGGSGSGRKRDIYPVSLSEKEILGLKAYSSVRDIPDKIDLAVIAVRADIVSLCDETDDSLAKYPAPKRDKLEIAVRALLSRILEIKRKANPCPSVSIRG